MQKFEKGSGHALYAIHEVSLELEFAVARQICKFSTSCIVVREVIKYQKPTYLRTVYQYLPEESLADVRGFEFVRQTDCSTDDYSRA